MAAMNDPEHAIGADEIMRPHGSAPTARKPAGQMGGVNRHRAVCAGEAGGHAAINRMQVGIDVFGVLRFRAWPAGATGSSARRCEQRAVVRVVIEDARGFRSGAGHLRQHARERVGWLRRTGIGVGDPVRSQLRQMLACPRSLAVGEIDGVQPIDAKQQDMLDAVSVILGPGRRNARGHAQDCDQYRTDCPHLAAHPHLPRSN